MRATEFTRRRRKLKHRQLQVHDIPSENPEVGDPSTQQPTMIPPLQQSLELQKASYGKKSAEITDITHNDIQKSYHRQLR